MSDSPQTDVSARAVLVEAFERVHDLVPRALEGLGPADLSWQPDEGSNPVGWLVWHLTRVQDDHLADLTGAEQVWTRDGFARRFDLPYEVADIGFGHTDEQVRQWRVEDVSLLTGYHEAVHAGTVEAVGAMSDEALGRVVDERWDPPVTALARLVSVVGDTMQHAGQAAYVKGLLERSRG